MQIELNHMELQTLVNALVVFENVLTAASRADIQAMRVLDDAERNALQKRITDAWVQAIQQQ